MSRADLLLVLVNIVITAFCSIMARLAVSVMEPLVFAVLSLTLGALPLLWLAARAGPISRLWDKRLLLKLMGLGFLGTSVTSLLVFYASRIMPPSRIVILSQAEILYSLFFGTVFLKERIGSRQLAATALILMGMALALKAGNFDSFGRGEIMILAMPVCFQLSHLIGKRLLAELGAEMVAAARTVYGIAFLLPLIPWLTLWPAWRDALIVPRNLGLIVVQGIILNALSLWMWYVVLSRVDLSRVTTMILTYPLVTLLAVGFIPGVRDSVSASQFVGAALVVAGGSMLARIPATDEESRRSP